MNARRHTVPREDPRPLGCSEGMRCFGSVLLAAALSCLTGCGKSYVAQPLTWETDDVAALARSAREHRLLFVYVSAEWDTAAKELEHKTFADALVRHELRRFVNLHIDMTDDDRPSTVRATQRFKIIGEPALLVLAPDGETELVRIHHFVTPDQLLAVLRAQSESIPAL